MAIPTTSLNPNLISLAFGVTPTKTRIALKAGRNTCKRGVFSTIDGSPGPAERASRFSYAFSPLFRAIEFVAYPKNSVVEIVGDHTEHANFSSVVHMFADTGAGKQ